jgi:glycosyltransferase involved in cell wall biosynthesis
MKRVCVIAHSNFPQDPRIRKETVAIADAGYDVRVICLRAAGEPAEDCVGAIRVRRLPISRDRSQGRLGYLVEYARFWLGAAVALRDVDRDSPVDLVVVHNIPEQLVYAAYRQKRRGVPVLLDMHDPLPELFADKYGLSEGSLVKDMLVRMELACCRFADHVIVATKPMQQRLVGLGLEEDGITVVMNSPDGELGPLSTCDPPRFVLVYHGSVFPRYGLDVVLRGLAAALERAPGVELHVFCSDTDPSCLAELRSLAGTLGIADRVAFNGYVAPLALRRILAGADAGVSPLRRSSHIDLAYPTKVLEYLACGLPVLAASTPAMRDLLGDGPVDFYEPDSPEGLADALVAMVERTSPVSLPVRFSQLKREVAWGEMSDRCVDVVGRLVAGGARIHPQSVVELEAHGAGRSPYVRPPDGGGDCR